MQKEQSLNDIVAEKDSNLVADSQKNQSLDSVVSTNSLFERLKSSVSKKAKKWAVDTYAFGEMLTLMGMLNELVIHQMDGMTCLKARAYNLALFPLIGPVMELRDSYREHIWGINKDSSALRNKAADFTWSMLMQATFYLPSLVVAGEHDPKKLAYMVGTRLLLNSALHTSLSFPYLKYVRKSYGTTPAYENKGKEK
jgi:hypothetical protein